MVLYDKRWLGLRGERLRLGCLRWRERQAGVYWMLMLMLTGYGEDLCFR